MNKNQDTILKINQLAVSFHTYAGEVQAIRNIDLDLYKGETLAVVGESGSGKSVMTKTIMGLLPKRNAKIKKGEIFFNDKDILRLSERKMDNIRGKDIAMIFQDPMTSLNPTMTIGKQIIEPLRKHRKMSRLEARQRALELLELVGISKAEERLKQYPHQFSGGMRQRVVIAIALACNPQILIADEPTTALDVTVQAQILELLKALQKKTKMSIIFITHDLGVVANIADRVAVMYAGKIVEVGTAEDIFYHPQHPYTWGLIRSMPTLDTRDEELYAIPGSPPDLISPPKGDAFAPRNEYAVRIDTLEPPPMFKISDSHYAATWLLHPDCPKVKPSAGIIQSANRFSGLSKAEKRNGSGTAAVNQRRLLEINHLKKYFKQGSAAEVKAVDDISFYINEGETFGLVGESGCGKSTTGRTIIDLYEATDGKVLFEGKNIYKAKVIHKDIQMIFQDPYASLDPRMTVKDIIAEGLDVHHLTKTSKERDERVYDLLETVGLSREHAGRYPHEFSGGQRQRIGIARALAVDPKLIIADEPISALDVSIQAQVVNLLKKLQKEHKLTYLFIAHDLSMVKYISDRIGVMYAGKLLELADSDELYMAPLHPYTESLLSAIPLPDPIHERTRKRKVFDASLPIYGPDGKAGMHEIVEGHYVYCTDAQVDGYKRKHAELTGQLKA